MVTFVFPKFDVRDFPETSFKNPDLVKAKFNEAMAAVNARDKELERLALNNEALETKFTEASRTVAINNAELQSLRKELATEVGRAQELRERLDKLDLQLPKISVQDLVGQFKGNIDRINAEVISRKTDGIWWTAWKWKCAAASMSAMVCRFRSFRFRRWGPTAPACCVSTCARHRL